MKHEVKIVIGSAFGDEGKGVTVQHLCKEAIGDGKRPIVIRFSGGPQAGHTVNLNGVEHVCSTYGSGVLLGVPTLVYETAYFDPLCAKKEYDYLAGKIDKVPDLYVCHNVRCITPYDVFFGRTNTKVLSDGTCGKGIFQTFKRHKDGCKTNLYSFVGNGLSIVCEYYSDKECNEKVREDISKLIDYEHNLFSKPEFGFIKAVGDIDKFLERFDVLIFEGSQGQLLDMDCGFYPHVTPSKVGLNGIEERWLQDAEVYFVTRTYLTRHGNGYEPLTRCFENINLDDKHETNVLNTYQGHFKMGVINFDLLNEAFMRHNIDNKLRLYNMKANLVVTHWDVLEKGNVFPYILNGFHLIDYTESSELYSLFRYFPKTFKFDKMYINDSIESNLKLRQ